MHGLVGENGAGKSTLMKIIAGVLSPISAARCASTDTDAVPLGARLLAPQAIGMVHQELSVIPDLTVAENVLLGHQPLGKMRRGRLAAHDARGRRPYARPRHRD